MAGEPGLELWGPYETYDEIRDAILEAGQEFGIEPCGARAYASNTLESGWIPSPLPAIYTGEELVRGYREWLGADSYEANNALAGSFVSDNIEDYYLNPWELGYGQFVKFDHDFIGRDALEQIEPEPQRKKVTLAWDDEDVAQDPRLGPFDPTRSRTSSSTCRSPTTARRTSTRCSIADGNVVGLLDVHAATAPTRSGRSRSPPSTRRSRSAPRSRSSGASRTAASRKTTVDHPHRQIHVRAIVSPVPYSEPARLSYHDGWRTATAG